AVTRSLRDQLRPLVEERQHDVATLRGEEQERARGARLAEVVELGLVGWGGEDRDGDRLYVAAFPGRDLLQLLPRREEARRVAPAREPALAEVDHAVHGVLRLA